MNRTLPIYISLVLLCAAQLGLGQPGRRGGGGGWDRDRVETVIIGKFATELELSNEQAEKFFPRFRTFRNEIEQIHLDQRGRESRLMELGQGGEGGQEVLTDLLKQQEVSMNLISAKKGQFLADVSGFLSPPQTARCAILLDEVPRRIREMIDERRDGDSKSPPLSGPGRGGRRGRGN
jgi:hypothetical protein